MSKCYPIDRRLQMRRNAKSSCGLRHNSSQASIERTIYVFFMRPAGMFVSPGPARHKSTLHDEFNGAQNISHLHAIVMTVHSLRPRRPVAAVLLVGLGVVGLGAGVGHAADEVSPWDGDARSTTRLIAGTRASDPGAPLRAGIEIRLSRGWHTYWRYPGDAGVPPRLDFAGSQNVQAVEVLWPAPRRLPEAGLATIGYDRDLILPLRVTRQDQAKPVVLAIKIDYAICEKLCVPAQAKAALALADSPSQQDARLAAAEARVPRKVALGTGSALAVRTVRREDARVLIDVAVPAGATVDMFAEGPTEEWSLPLPMAVDGAASGLQRFVLELDGAPPGAKYEGALITLTAVTDGDAIEVPIHLD
jgi:DsbC/DsbD-like thiol-disulfide interchange protein